MSDDTNSAAPAEQAAPRLQVLSQYIRDLSFENIAMRDNVQGEGNPDISVQVSLDAKKKGENDYEVINKVKVDAKQGEARIFLLELEYAGLFRVENVPEDKLHPFLMIECPRMIFPYLRRIVGDVTRDGGFPPLNLDNIDFLALYRQEIARRQAMQEKENQPVS
ncbi:protein-export chaperone SecB [Halovulum sp. GXIMD14793]